MWPANHKVHKNEYAKQEVIESSALLERIVGLRPLSADLASTFTVLATQYSKAAEPHSVMDEVEVKEAAQLIRRHKSFVYRMIYSGLLPATKIGGRVKLKRNDLLVAVASITKEVQCGGKSKV